MTDPISYSAPVLSYTNLKDPTLTTPLMRRGRLLVTNFKATLPPLCPICGQPGNGKIVQLRINVAESFVMRAAQPDQSFVVLEATFCPRHYLIRRNAFKIVIALAMVAILCAIHIVSIKAREGDTPMASLLIGAAALVAMGSFFVIASRRPRRHRTEKNFAYLTGVDPKLLALLPSLPPRPVIR